MRAIMLACLCCLAMAACDIEPAVAGGDSCSGFKWDIAKEKALFGGVSVSLSAGKDNTSAPAIVPGKLYALELVPQNTVTFAAAPGRVRTTESHYAGLAALTIPTAGHYRVSVDAPLWIDVAVDGKRAPVADFQGQADCAAPRKIVEFELTGATHFVVQMSGAATAEVHMTVTEAPLRKS